MIVPKNNFQTFSLLLQMCLSTTAFSYISDTFMWWMMRQLWHQAHPYVKKQSLTSATNLKLFTKLWTSIIGQSVNVSFTGILFILMHAILSIVNKYSVLCVSKFASHFVSCKMKSHLIYSCHEYSDLRVYLDRNYSEDS